MADVIHQCPPDGKALTPCCGRTPFELAGDRITTDADLVTCKPSVPCQWIDQALLIPCGFPADYVTQVEGVELAVCDTHARLALHNGARKVWEISDE